MFYVSPDGNDAWTGKRANVNYEGNDGPFATITKARDAIRKMKALGLIHRPMLVFLRGGLHRLQEPLVFTPEDSGTSDCPIIYTAYPGETPVISGGERIGNWQRTEQGRWTAQVPASTPPFRQLFVNGRRRYRSRLPKQGYYRVAELPGIDEHTPYDTPADRFIFATGDLNPNWTNLADVEVVALHFWVDTHLPVAAIDEDKRLVTFTKQSRRKLTDDHTMTGARYYVDNIYEGMSEPGEWYLNRSSGKVSYIPTWDEDMEQAEAIAPRLSQLVSFEGDPENNKYVEHIHLKDITLSHTEWNLPENDAGDYQSAVDVPGAIVMRGACHCVVEHCRLQNLGTYAIEIAGGCEENIITGNEIAENGGGGIKMSGGDASSPLALRTRANWIANNHLHHLGQIYHSAAGILLRHSAGNTIAHNHIHHLYYTGISIGWVWGYSESVSRENLIEYNHIHDIGQGMLSDMGGIYTLGVSPGTIVRNNLIHDIQAWGYGGWGIYTDEGSSGILIENNLVYRTKSGGFHQHYGRENVVSNNIFALSKTEQIARTRQEEHLSFVFEHNIVYWENGPLLGGRWSDDRYHFDYNVYYESSGEPVRFGEWTFEEWRQRGQDVHSVIADPEFVDPEHGNFKLKPSSPAFNLGFKPVDLSSVGPQ